MTDPAVYRNALAAQTMLHEYRLESVLGAGSFGVTYLGWDTNLEKHVAIKEYLPAELAMRAADGSVVPLTTEAESGYKWGLERYILEARTLARFSHPNIVRVNRYFEANGSGYMVMDYERGEPLAALLKRSPRPEEVFLKRMLAPLLDGLRAVHATGFLHRDIKPDNIFLRADGSPALIDFGAARQSVGDATRTLTAVLTPGYAPLEQYFSEGRQGPWTDLYALAGVLYRAVTNESPPDAVTRLKGDRVGEVLARARDRYSEAFLKALRWALEPEEKKRPQSVQEWQRVFAGAPVPAAAAVATHDAATVRIAPAAAKRPGAEARPRTTQPAARSAPSAPAREPWPWWVRAFALLLVAAAALGLWHRHRSAQERALQAERTTPSPAASAPTRTLRAAEPPATSPAAASVPQATLPPGAEPRNAQELPQLSDERVERLRREAQREFRSADTDGDGTLSRREVKARFPFLAREFDRIDTDGDGRISFEEFLAVRRAQLQRKLERPERK